MAKVSKGASVEKAGKLHDAVFDILLKMTEPTIVEHKDGTTEEVYNLDWVKVAITALKNNEIQCLETVESNAGKLREALAKRQKIFGNKVQPLFTGHGDENKGIITEDTLNDSTGT